MAKDLKSIVNSALNQARYIAKNMPTWITAAYIAAAPAYAGQAGVCEDPSGLTRQTLQTAHDRVIIPEVEVRVGDTIYKLGVREQLPPIEACPDDYVEFFPSEAIIRLPKIELAYGVNPQVKYWIEIAGRKHEITGPFKPEDLGMTPGLNRYGGFVECDDETILASVFGYLTVKDCAEPVAEVPECISTPALTDSTTAPADKSRIIGDISSTDSTPPRENRWRLGAIYPIIGEERGISNVIFDGNKYEIGSFERSLEEKFRVDITLVSPDGNFQVKVGRRNYKGENSSHLTRFFNSRVEEYFAAFFGYNNLLRLLHNGTHIGFGGNLDFTHSISRYGKYPTENNELAVEHSTLAPFLGISHNNKRGLLKVTIGAGGALLVQSSGSASGLNFHGGYGFGNLQIDLAGLIRGVPEERVNIGLRAELYGLNGIDKEVERDELRLEATAGVRLFENLGVVAGYEYRKGKTVLEGSSPFGSVKSERTSKRNEFRAGLEYRL